MADRRMSASRADRELTPEEVRRTLLLHAQRRVRRDLTANFRSFLAPTVTHASPLLLDACSVWAVDLDAMLNRLRPPAGWPHGTSPKRSWRPLPPRPPRVLGRGLVGHRVQVLVGGSTLEVRTWLGDAFACTADERLSLWLTQRMPETVVDGMLGRELASVIDHPVLRLRPYRVLGGCSIGHGTVIDAAAPPVQYRLPWA